MKRNKPRQNIIKAFNAAIEGVIYTFKHERNMKIHYIIAIVVLLISLFLDLDRVEMMILLLSISLVIVSEMFNTAVENAVDLITNEIHPLAKIAKDVAAGGVLIASLNAVAVGYLIFYDKFMHLSQSVIVSIRKSDPHVTLICIVLVLISVVVVKSTYFYRNASSRRYAKWSCSISICTCYIYNYDYRKSNSISFGIYNGNFSCTKQNRRKDTYILGDSCRSIAGNISSYACLPNKNI